MTTDASTARIDVPRTRAGIWLAATRPKTLFAAAAPVVIGAALAVFDSVAHALSASCALMSALFIQIGTNLYNDYSDARKGSDTDERIGPLRVTQAGLLTEKQVLGGTIVAFGLAVAAGSYLMIRGGLPIVIVGVLSIAFGFLYSGSRFSLSSLGVADVFVLVFFGPVAVGGTYFVQSLELSPVILFAGVAPGLLATAILVVNNVRDIQQDKAADKKTLIVRFGRSFGVFLYATCMTLAGLTPLALVLFAGYPPTILLACAILILAFPMVRKLAANRDGPTLNSLLASTGAVLLLYAVLFTIGLLIG